MAGSGNAALYLRLSREDGDGHSESESIRNQRDFLMKYAQEQGFRVAGVYADDGYSGVSFDRPEFQRMLRDIEAGRIDTVLTRDLSRLGRDYIMTGHYVEVYFPSRRVRYIAVSDGVDTFASARANDMTPFRAVFNDMYAKDISAKVRVALLTKKRSGAFIGSTAPYGYRKSREDKNRLEIDEETAPFVRRIFRLYLGGDGVPKIARELTAAGIPTPSRAKGLHAGAAAWSAAMVKRILTNPTYMGNLTQNRAQKLSYKLDRRIALPESQWIVVEHTHEALVSEQDFRAARERLRVRVYAKTGRGGGGHPLTGLVFCADCLSPMSAVRSGGRSYLVCRTWRRGAGKAACASHCIREDLVLSELTGALRALVRDCIDREALARDLEAPPDMSERQAAPGLQKRLDSVQRTRVLLYRDRADGLLSAECHRDALATLAAEERRLSALLSDLLRVRDRSQNDASPAPEADRILDFREPDREILAALVGRVLIGKGHAVTAEMAFPDPRPRKYT